MTTATRAEAPDFKMGNSQLLMDYRTAILEAYRLGEDIKAVYGIQPPKVISEKTWDAPRGVSATNIVIGLTVN